jgi:trans-aconitate methyltransferase
MLSAPRRARVKASYKNMSEKTKSPQSVAVPWDATLYDSKHAFVWKYGAEVIELLAPKPGERILDMGCGTGHLTAAIASHGADVVGVDRSAAMVAAARKEYPNLTFEVADATELPFRGEFDAVFSNATLHWIREPERPIRSVWNALKPHGRFVAELGGKGNIRKMQEAFDKTRADLNLEPVDLWYYPSVGEYSNLLEKQGFEVRFMTLFDRPTVLAEGEPGMRNWIEMFGADYYKRLSLENREIFVQKVEELLRPELFRDGQWCADYRRLRFVAVK